MSAASLSILIYRGTDPVLRFTLSNVTDALGNPIDITLWTTTFTVRKVAPAPDPVIFQASGVIDDAPSRRFKVAMTKAQTLALKVGNYVCSFERVNAGAADLLGIGSLTVAYDILNPKA